MSRERKRGFRTAVFVVKTIIRPPDNSFWIFDLVVPPHADRIAGDAGESTLVFDIILIETGLYEDLAFVNGNIACAEIVLAILLRD